MSLIDRLKNRILARERAARELQEEGFDLTDPKNEALILRRTSEIFDAETKERIRQKALQWKNSNKKKKPPKQHGSTNNGSLNNLQIPNRDGPDEPLIDHSCVSADGKVECVLRDLEPRLISYIGEYKHMVGSVAWLTSLPVLTAMAGLQSVSVLVQKEDFLRPDGKGDNWPAKLRTAYRGLQNTKRRHDYGGHLGNMSVFTDLEFDPVRCIGNHNADKNPAFPRAHHKFIVGLRYDELGFHPESVWTGSFNFTANGTRSFENALIVRDTTIATAYFNEWRQLACLSEELDWTSTWCAPEWRIGT